MAQRPLLTSSITTAVRFDPLIVIPGMRVLMFVGYRHSSEPEMC